MSESAVPTNSENRPNDQEAKYLALGISAAQTSYELNNGFGIASGSPLRFFDDSNASTLPGSRPLKMMELDNFFVYDVFNDTTT